MLKCYIILTHRPLIIKSHALNIYWQTLKTQPLLPCISFKSQLYENFLYYNGVNFSI